jgi:Protein of unknown function (DUF4236)
MPCPALSFQDVPLRFHRSIRLAPGIHVNLGLHGAGLSVGRRGLHVGVNRRGIYTSAGIPGTGIYAVHHIRNSAQQHPNVVGKRSGLSGGLRVRCDYPSVRGRVTHCGRSGTRIVARKYCGVTLTLDAVSPQNGLIVGSAAFSRRAVP